MNNRSHLAYKYTTLATRQRDVVVVRTALTTAMVVPATMFKVYDPPNSETLVSKLFPNFPVVNTTWEAVHVQFPIRKLVFTIIPIACEGSISLVISCCLVVCFLIFCRISWINHLPAVSNSVYTSPGLLLMFMDYPSCQALWILYPR